MPRKNSLSDFPMPLSKSVGPAGKAGLQLHLYFTQVTREIEPASIELVLSSREW